MGKTNKGICSGFCN